MSVKEFFAFGSLKATVIEYLKNKADYENLQDKFKKPFRAHINKHQEPNAGAEPVGENREIDEYSGFFVSDGWHSIKCHFSKKCRKAFEELYPTSVRISNLVNMLIAVESFSVELRS